MSFDPVILCSEIYSKKLIRDRNKKISQKAAPVLFLIGKITSKVNIQKKKN